jgi:hypothetical protein
MFPEQFWFDATLLVVFATVAQASLLAGGSWWGLRKLQSSNDVND